MRVLTWHVHGSYLYYLSHTPVDFILPVKPGRPEGYGGRSGHFPWPDNVHEVHADEVRDLVLDAVLFQSRRNLEVDQYELLSPEQRRLPRVYLEHDPPRESPTDTRHHVDDPSVLVVHVTPFNALMWDSGRSPVEVIDHGVTVPAGVRYRGHRPEGIVVVNGLRSRGRRLGADVFERVAREVPLTLAGMESEAFGGLGDIPRADLLAREAEYRFFFHPIRYTSLGLAVLEAMHIGMPVVGLATTELVTVLEDGVSGCLDTNVDALIPRMHALLEDPAAARRIGEAGRRRAVERFSIERFVADWSRLFSRIAAPPHRASSGPSEALVEPAGTGAPS